MSYSTPCRPRPSTPQNPPPSTTSLSRYMTHAGFETTPDNQLMYSAWSHHLTCARHRQTLDQCLFRGLQSPQAPPQQRALVASRPSVEQAHRFCRVGDVEHVKKHLHLRSSRRHTNGEDSPSPHFGPHGPLKKPAGKRRPQPPLQLLHTVHRHLQPETRFFEALLRCFFQISPIA